MIVDQDTIDAIRRGVNLAWLVRSRGVTLLKNGQGYKGRCPFHADEAPSAPSPSLEVKPGKGVWKCLTCGASGDAIRFVQMFDRISYFQAAERLTALLPPALPASAQTPPPPLPYPPRTSSLTSALLGRVSNYYQRTFAVDRRGLDYLKSIGITRKDAMEAFGVGLANGTLAEATAGDRGLSVNLKDLGLLIGNGIERFYHSVTFPLYDEIGAVVGLYGRSMFDDGVVITHRYMPGPRRGLINRQAAARSSSILLTQSVIDALTLYDQGFTEVIPCYGPDGFTVEHLALFEASKVREVYIVFPGDEAGSAATGAVMKSLYAKGITSHCVRLPGTDVNRYFRRHAPEDFGKLLTQANPARTFFPELTRQKKGGDDL